MKKIEERLSYYNNDYAKMGEAINTVKSMISKDLFPKDVIQDMLDMTVALQSYIDEYGLVGN